MAPESVTLVAVAKGQPAEKIVEAAGAGITDIGENYAQELKVHRVQLSAVSSQLRWHFIGHLQRNKVKEVVRQVELIHSVDSVRLAEEINRVAVSQGKIQPILIEVNLGGEGSKTGVSSDEVEHLTGEMNRFLSLQLKGFMAIPPVSSAEGACPEGARPFFQRLREIRDAINRRSLYKAPLAELSIGMTEDFEIAIEEGATMVRIGTGIFGPREAGHGEV